jgi:hypothetical protein
MYRKYTGKKRSRKRNAIVDRILSLNALNEYSFSRMDFNIQDFLSNLVLRWEYNPGSLVYLVWSQTRNSSAESSNLDLLNDLGILFNSTDNKPHNVFLIKFSYRFNLK